eukprot:scaffold1346_cov354-Pavlova_lutheri.AAC.4
MSKPLGVRIDSLSFRTHFRTLALFPAVSLSEPFLLSPSGRKSDRVGPWVVSSVVDRDPDSSDS